jgi:hypothetical protein
MSEGSTGIGFAGHMDLMLEKDDRVVTANLLDMPHAYFVYDHARAKNVEAVKNGLLQQDIFLSISSFLEGIANGNITARTMPSSPGKKPRIFRAPTPGEKSISAKHKQLLSLKSG